jgi:hypothetical protein
MNRFFKPGKFLLIVASFLAAACQAQAQNGLVKTEWPTMEDPGIPFYARVEIYEPYIFNDGEWAAIIFYRDPACVPDDFNLLTLLDVPWVFGCPHTVNGVSLWNGAAFNGAPKVINMTGNGQVPIWFVPWDDVKSEARPDGVLTMNDLMDIEDLSIGYASRFNERLQPHSDPAFGGGGHPNPKMIVTASGLMEDGRSFDLHIAWINDVVRSIDIRFD